MTANVDGLRSTDDPLDVHSCQALDALGYLRSNEKKLIIMGHSFGSLIAYHTTVALRSAYNFTPWYLILAGGITPRVGATAHSAAMQWSHPLKLE